MTFPPLWSEKQFRVPIWSGLFSCSQPSVQDCVLRKENELQFTQHQVEISAILATVNLFGSKAVKSVLGGPLYISAVSLELLGKSCYLGAVRVKTGRKQD